MTKNEAAEIIANMHEKKGRGDMPGAYALVKSLDDRFVKSAYDQLAIADVCIQEKQYEEALKWLKKVKEHSTSKRLLVQLIYVCLKLNRMDEAHYYYAIFEKNYPEGTDRYVLEYRIRRQEGADYPELIELLKLINEDAFSERWSFELAKTYHKAEMEKECIAECDKIILWFGEGPIVDKAKKLRAYHTGEVLPVEEKKEEPVKKEEEAAKVQVEEVSEEVVGLAVEKAVEDTKETQKKEETVGTEEVAKIVAAEATVAEEEVSEEPVVVVALNEQTEEKEEETVSEEKEEEIHEAIGGEEVASLVTKAVGEVTETPQEVVKVDLGEHLVTEKAEQPETLVLEIVEKVGEKEATEEEEKAEETEAESEPETKEEPDPELEDYTYQGLDTRKVFQIYAKDEEVKHDLREMVATLKEDETDGLLMAVEGTNEYANAFIIDYLKFLWNTEVIDYLRVARIPATTLNELKLTWYDEELTDATLLVTGAEDLTDAKEEEIRAMLDAKGRRTNVVLLYHVEEDRVDELDFRLI
ncbi:MAG: hypothetical protein IJ744_11980 [Lachnospiraceae bacterium]|nr:hypothetical protein [Lachnospiraceae bacterium]